MRRLRFQLQLAIGVVVVATVAAGAARAADNYPFRASLYYGLGGSVDDSSSKSLDHGSYQLGFSWASDAGILAGIRYGQIDFGGDSGPGGRVGASLDYVTISGEYLFNEGYYTSGVYIGLGWYDVGAGSDGLVSGDSGVGLVVGLTGDFRLTDRFSILVELSAHYTQLERTDLLAMGHVGVGYRF